MTEQWHFHFILACILQCHFKSADPGNIMPTPEQCQASAHGCLINAASSYRSANVFGCAFSCRHTTQWSGHSSWHSICGQNPTWVLPARNGAVRLRRGDAGSQHTAFCSHSSRGNLLALCWFCGHKERRTSARDQWKSLGWYSTASPFSQLRFGWTET